MLARFYISFIFFHNFLQHPGLRVVYGCMKAPGLPTSWTSHYFFLKGHIDKQCRITDHLESAISLTCMSLGCGKKPEYLEGTHEETRRTCKHHKGRRESNPWPSCCEAGDSANHCVTSGLKVADVFDLSVLKISKCGWFEPIGIWTFILGGNSCTLHQSAFTLFQSRVQSLLLLIQLNVMKAMILFP